VSLLTPSVFPMSCTVMPMRAISARRLENIMWLVKISPPFTHCVIYK
jgi:hypothetical protein